MVIETNEKSGDDYNLELRKSKTYLILFILNFVFLSSNLSLENISFM